MPFLDRFQPGVYGKEPPIFGAVALSVGGNYWVVLRLLVSEVRGTEVKEKPFALGQDDPRQVLNMNLLAELSQTRLGFRTMNTLLALFRAIRSATQDATQLRSQP